MNIEYIIIIIMCLAFTFVFSFIEPLLMKHKVKNDNEYGSARFATTKEIKEKFNEESINNINEAGFPVFFSRNLKKIYFDRETPHYVYLGSTGSGKSVTAVIPTCTFIANAKRKRSVFVTDPKGEIFHTTSKMFQNNGYNILTIDFRHPEKSNKLNILEPIIIEYEKYLDNIYKSNKKKITKEEKLNYNNIAMSSLAETNRLIKSLANMIMQEKVEQKDPFWNNSAQSLLEGIIGFYLEEYQKGNIKREQITMTSIRKFQNSSMESANFLRFKKYLSKKEYGQKSKDSLTSILSTSDNTYKSITGVFGEKMSLFDDINVANVISSSDFDFNILGKEPTALYLIVPDEDKSYYKLITIIVGLLYKELVKLANNNEDKKLPIEIDFILDEFANCPPLADIDTIVSVARSRGMHFHFFIQSFSQLDNVYGKDIAQIILDNSGTYYLKTNTMSTAEQISKMLGKKTIESNSVRQSISLLNYNGDRSTNLIGRDLMTPEEVKQLHYKAIIFPTDGFPIYRKTIVYKRFSCYKSGEVERKDKPLIDLSHTYYTVEKIKLEHEKEDNKEAIKEFEEEQINQDKELLKHVEEVLKKTFKDNCQINYEKLDNGRLFIKSIINHKITPRDRVQLSSRIKKELYHVDILEEGNSAIISVYNENNFLMMTDNM